MTRSHRYQLTVTWTGDRGEGTATYRSYDRDHEVTATGKPAIPGSSDPAFRGAAERWNPEELLVASLAQCHLLWYLHLCAEAGIVVTGYVDNPLGTMTETPDGGGRFTDVLLRPVVTITDPGRRDEATGLHGRAHRLCFVANSVNFPVRHEPSTRVASTAGDVSHEVLPGRGSSGR